MKKRTPLYVALVMLSVISHGCGSGSPSNPPMQPAAPIFWGIAYGPFRAGQSPNGGPQPTVNQMRDDIPRLALLGGRVRTYTESGNQAQIPDLAYQQGLKTWAGAWIGPVLTQNDSEIHNVIAVASQPGVEAVIVGNEVLLRGDVTSAQLVSYIRQVKSHVSVPIAYTDTWDTLEQHPEVVKEVDIVLANVHPYWFGIPSTRGADYVLARFQELQTKYPNKQIAVGETGWPSAGSPHGLAIPGATQQREFFNGLIAVLKQHPELRVFAFEAFDEAFKQDADVEPHWGIYNQDGSTKSGLVPLIPSEPADPTRHTGTAEAAPGHNRAR